MEFDSIAVARQTPQTLIMVATWREHAIIRHDGYAYKGEATTLALRTGKWSVPDPGQRFAGGEPGVVVALALPRHNARDCASGRPVGIGHVFLPRP